MIQVIQSQSEKPDVKIKVIAAFTVIYFVWGSTYLGIRYAIDTIPPFLMAGTRFIIAGLLFYGWCHLRGQTRPGLPDWKKTAVMGILMVCCGNGLVTWAEQIIPSGFAALVVATVPIWMVIIDSALCARNRPDRLTLAGIGLGLAGVALLSGVDKEILVSPTDHGGSVFLGVSVLLFASISWASGSLYARKTSITTSLPYMIGMQTIVGGIVLIILGISQGEWARFSLDEISFLSISALFYLITFGTILAYSAYVWLLKVSTPAKVGTYAYFNPLIAIFLGATLANEPVTVQMLIGTGCIIVSLLMINQPKFKKIRSGSLIRWIFPFQISRKTNGKGEKNKLCQRQIIADTRKDSTPPPPTRISTAGKKTVP
jgi:drug/metabolite transporter (DMT)-like permease